VPVLKKFFVNPAKISAILIVVRLFVNLYLQEQVVKTFTESPLVLPLPPIAAVVPSGHTSLLITLGAVAGVVGTSIGAAATIGMAVLPILREKFPVQMKNTQLDEYAQNLFILIATVNPILQELSPEHQEKIKQDLKDPSNTKELILSSPEEVVQKLTEEPS